MNTKKALFILGLLIFQSSFLHSQIWHFGQRAGLDFAGGDPVSIDGGQTWHQEGVAVQNNCNGGLLLYTDGFNVWDTGHVAFTGGPMTGNTSMTQALICPKPGSNGAEYFVFHGELGNGIKGANIFYSVIDVITNSFLQIDQWLPSGGPKFFEGMSLMAHANGDDYWLVTHEGSTDGFNVYLIDSANGLTHSATYNYGTAMSFGSTCIGYMAATKNNDKIAYANYGTGKAEVFGFNNSTGVVTGLLQSFNSGAASYGVEFSPNGDYLFIGKASPIPGQKGLIQGDIATGNMVPIDLKRIGAIRRGPNDKLYTATINENDVGVINDPNNWGAAVNFDPTTLGGFGFGFNKIQDGLPTLPVETFCPVYPCPIPKDSIVDTVLCFGESLELSYGSVSASGSYNDTIYYIINHNSPPDTCEQYYMVYNLTVLDEVLNENILHQVDAEDSVEVSGVWFYEDTVLTEQYIYSGMSCDSLIRVTQIEVEKIAPPLIPNVFTPGGGEGKNDFFEIVFIEGCKACELEVDIYNRWGKVVFSGDRSNFWDGTINGSPAAEGTYFYTVKTISPEGEIVEYKGSLTLMR